MSEAAAKKPGVGALPASFNPYSFRGVLLVSLIYGMAHTLVRLTAGFNLALDDQKENIFTQTWEWGYLPDNPPLYEWCLHIVQWFTGPTLFSFLILKYALLVWTAAFLFLAGRRLFNDDKWATLTVYSATLLYQTGYNYHQAFTHSLMVIAMVAFALWAFIRLEQERRLADYALFGLAIGLGLISKYNFAGFLAVMLIPSLFDRNILRVLIDVRMLVAVAIAAVICAPHFLWVADHQTLSSKYVTMKLGRDDGSHLARMVEGLGNMTVAVVSFFLPFLLIAPFVFRRAFSKDAIVGHQPTGLPRVLALSLPAAVVIMTVGVLFLGVSNVTERYVVPFLLPGFFWMMWHLEKFSDDKIQIRWGQVLLVVGAIVLIVRFFGVFVAGAPVCDDCQRWRPFYAIRDTIREAKLPEDAIYVGYEENTAGNLRRLLPDAEVRAFNLLFYQPLSQSAEARPCYFVWSEEITGQPVAERLRQITDTKRTLKIVGEWRHPFKQESWRTTEWGIAPILPKSRFYKNLCTVQ